MTDNNNIIVYCEYEDGKVADVSLELLTKGRVLADKLGVKLEALVIGDKLDKIENSLYPYGVDVVYKVEDKRLYPYTSNPHSAILINLFREIKPQICLMGATCIGRDLGPRVSSVLPLTVRHLKSATIPTQRPERNTKTCFIRFVRLLAAIS